MTKLEEKVTDLITTEAIVASEKKALATAFAPHLAEMEKVKKTICPALEDTEAEVVALRKEILGLMTDKTYKFDFATITKQINKGLKIFYPRILFQHLCKINLGKLVTFGFKKSDIIKAVELGALVFPAKGETQFAEITETASLRVTVTKD